MRKREIIKEFGESYVAQTMLNLGYEVDRLDAEGIDLAANEVAHGGRLLG